MTAIQEGVLRGEALHDALGRGKNSDEDIKKAKKLLNTEAIPIETNLIILQDEKPSDAYNYLQRLQSSIFEKKWSIRFGGGERIFLKDIDEKNAKNAKSTENIIPKGVMQILTAIDNARLQKENNPSACVDALHEIKVIAQTHTNYSQTKILFFGQDRTTRQWYHDTMAEINNLIKPGETIKATF